MPLPSNPAWRVAFAAALTLAGPAAVAAPSDGLTETELRGHQLYREGTSAHGHEVIAKVGAEAVVLPASAVPCASCHGPDGRGRAEGGVIPPDIRWSELVKTYGHVHHDGRRHPPFDDDSFIRSMIAGISRSRGLEKRSVHLFFLSVL